MRYSVFMDSDGDLCQPTVASDARTSSASLSKLRHDLRTPLNQIIGYSELLQEEAEGGATSFLSDLAKINSAARRLLTDLDAVFELFRDVSRQEVFLLTPDPPPVSLPPGAIGESDEDAHSDLPVSGFELGQTSSILIVDDNDKNRDMLSRRLRRRGFEVHLAADGMTALELIDQRKFDLIVLDVMMPGINGLEVLQRIRQQFAMSELPVIMATARNASEDVVHALQAGANDYVTKPIDLAVLLARTNTQLELKRSAEEIRNLAGQLEARNQFIQQAFGRYLSDEVVESLLATPEGLALGGESRTVTIMMCDLRGFSSLSEGMSPAQVVVLLNNYLSQMTDVILKYQGTIDEFIGDAILVVFGAPVPRIDHAQRAVACAIEMQLAMQKVNSENERLGLPHVEMGIGINTGEVVVGNIGSNRRAKYAVVGRHVNLATRIEALTVGGQVFISDSTRTEVGDTLRLIGTNQVLPKGAKQPMMVHQVEGILGDVTLWLPRETSQLMALLESIRVRFAVLDGVNTATDECVGEIVQLSRSACVIRSESHAPQWGTLKLRLHTNDDLSTDGDVYGKVLAVAPAVGEFRLHFTSVPPPVRLAIELLLG